MIKIKNTLPLTIGIEKTDCILKLNAQGTNTRHNELVFQCELFLNDDSANNGKTPVVIDPKNPFYKILQPIQIPFMDVVRSNPKYLALFNAVSEAYYEIATTKLNEIINEHNAANPDDIINLNTENV